MPVEQEVSSVNFSKGLLVNSSDGLRSAVTLWADKTTHRLLVDVGTVSVSSSVLPGFNIPAYDYITVTTASTTETYVYKTGGSGGTTVATIIVTYTDSTKATISTIAKT